MPNIVYSYIEQKHRKHRHERIWRMGRRVIRLLDESVRTGEVECGGAVRDHGGESWDWGRRGGYESKHSAAGWIWEWRLWTVGLRRMENRMPQMGVWGVDMSRCSINNVRLALHRILRLAIHELGSHELGRHELEPGQHNPAHHCHRFTCSHAHLRNKTNQPPRPIPADSHVSQHMMIVRLVTTNHLHVRSTIVMGHII